ncbi:hypothetical protein F4777DRAFT_581613 [Nemania sp. FL0916]|nr:hypothetical protein F4777DRAFT_581613 [Nemania sp. FL0916]
MASKDAAVGWQASPSRRGTLDIIENCLFTIIACTWSIQHLNVPRLHEAWRPGLLRKCKWAIFTIFFPEFLMAHAIVEFVTAVEDMRLLEEKGLLEDSFPWLYRLFWRSPNCSNDEEARKSKRLPATGDAREQEVRWTLTHCYFANMGGFYIRDTTSQHGFHILTTRHFAEYHEHIRLPSISEDDLKDKSKTDPFTKFLAVFQILQLVLSLAVRQARRLAFSQLETLTLAFAIFGVLTYVCSWYKLQGVNTPIEVRLNKPLPRGIEKHSVDSLWRVLTNSGARGDARYLDRIRNDNISRTKARKTHWALWVLTILTAGFGSIHTIAWSSQFPTFPEQLLWKIATIISVAAPPFALIAIPLSQIIMPWGDSGDFSRTCWEVMKEYSWHEADNAAMKDAMRKLDQARHNRQAPMHYEEVLGSGEHPESFLGEKLCEYLQNDDVVRNCLPEDFLPKFTTLVRILREASAPKRLWDAMRTDTYPQRSLFGTWLNGFIIYGAGIVYCLARFSIIGVAFSSLRSMPDSVYYNTWTQYIPSIQ